jgi:integrase/recombinase XerC/integrase/recombinase XerD
MTLCHAVDAYLATLAGAEQAATRRQYGKVLTRMTAHFGPDAGLTSITPESFAEWFRSLWQDSAPSTWNSSLAAVKGAVGYWTRQGWTGDDPTRILERRRQRPDRSRALDRAEVEHLLTDKKNSVRDRTLWTLLYESAARSAEVLSLDVEDLDLANNRAKVTRKGGAQDVIIWQTKTAVLLSRLLKGRTSGPVFVTERKARVQLAASDLDDQGHARLSYDQARQIFQRASGGKTLHQLRHSALTHEAERGTSTPMLMARSGHTSVRSLAKYARVSAEALARHQAQRDPARRR